MNTDKNDRKYPESDLTEKIIGAAIKVSNALGTGFLEKVYENALVVEFGRAQIPFLQQEQFQVKYESAVVGQYIADIAVDGRVIVEVKAAKQLDPVHDAQLLNYLKATGIRAGLLLNFGRAKLQFKRLVF